MRKLKGFILALFAVIFLIAFMADVTNAQSITVSPLQINRRGVSTFSDTLGYSAGDTMFTARNKADFDSLQFLHYYSDSAKIKVNVLYSISETDPYVRVSTPLDTITATSAGIKAYNYSAIVSKIGQPFGAVMLEYVFLSSGNAVDTGRYFKTFTKKFYRK